MESKNLKNKIDELDGIRNKVTTNVEYLNNIIIGLNEKEKKNFQDDEKQMEGIIEYNATLKAQISRFVDVVKDIFNRKTFDRINERKGAIPNVNFEPLNILSSKKQIDKQELILPSMKDFQEVASYSPELENGNKER